MFVALQKIWYLLWPKNMPRYHFLFFVAMLAMIMSKIFLLMVPYLFKFVIDNLEQFQSFQMIMIPVMVYGLCRFLSSFFSEIRDLTFAKITQRSLRQLGLKVFDHLHALSLEYHLQRQTGGLARVIERGTKSLETMMTFLTFNIIPTAIEIILVSFFVGVMYGFMFMAIIIVTMLLYIVYTIKLTEWRVAIVKAMNAEETQAQFKAIDSLLNYETVKYFNNERHEHLRFDEGLKSYEIKALNSRKSLGYLNVGQSFILGLGLVSIMLLSAKGVSQKILTLGDMVAINTFLIQLTIPLFNLGFAYREIKLAFINLDELNQLLEIDKQIKDIENPIDIKEIKRGFFFKKVTFRYLEKNILQDFDLEIPLGKTVAIVGQSGAGKSTLTRLLYRFYDVNEGNILVDDIPIREVAQNQLRAFIGIVPQDTVLFNDTILYNIAYGCPQSNMDEIINVAKQAKIYDFIQSLPEKFGTRVGERGLKLSGGEKQRISIARTLLKKPQLYIFDEATSALDSHTEGYIQEQLDEIAEHSTCLIIAHRLSTVVNADIIHVLDQGRIIESGSHHQLLKKEGAYFQLWNKQYSTEIL
ncbi:MAG: metal ABC transporter permease [Candidatus Puniceispirillum sp.]|nr:metal ABC transporter permease [Candidatus Pelagibacter sp.]MBA4282784.1 metal ABC transporter permease [Candidatus Puniceispirillum sp.]